jgi:glycosyltransferase involved in cell wall biosynthesis
MDPSVSISVVIPAYCVTGYIADAIDSVLAQTFLEFEIIVVNDGCPDTVNLELVLAPYLARNQIRYISQENRGVSGARNTGVRAARGALVSALDGDDLLRPNAFDVWLDVMRKHPNAGMVYGNAMFFGGSPLDGQEWMKYFPSRDNSVSYADLITHKAHVFGCAMFRRDVLLDVGLYDENLRKAEDYELALRIAKSGARIENTKSIVYDYRIHPGSLTTASGDIQVWRIRALEKHQKRPDLSPAENEMIAAELRYQSATCALEESKGALLNGEYRRARGRLRQANREFRSARLAIISLALLVLPAPLRQVALFRERRLHSRHGSLDKAPGL